MLQNFTELFVCSLLLSVGQVRAAEPVIGTAVSAGRLEVDRAMITGNANLHEGSNLKTGKAPVRIQLASGARAALGHASEARVHGDRLELTQGVGLVAPEYRLVAGGFSVRAAAGGQAHVHRRGETVEIAAVNGPVQVRDAAGLMVARVLPDQPIRLEPGTPGVSSMTGVLRRERNEYRLTDEVTNLDVTLRGQGLDAEVGRRVNVTGQARPEGDSQLIQVARLTAAPAQQPGAAKPTAPGSTVPPPSKGGGAHSMSAGAKAGLIAGIGGAAALAIILATRSDDSISR